MEKEESNTILAETDRALAKNYQDVLRNVVVAREDPSNLRVGIMTLVATSGIFLCVALLTFFSAELPRMVVGIIAMITGIFTLCLRDVYWSEFGSSRASRQKDEIVTALVQRGKF